MTQLLLFNVTNGLIIGAFYVLMALGLSLILNLSNVINFAHGGFLVIGGYIAYAIAPYVGFWGALPLAPPLTAVIGLEAVVAASVPGPPRSIASCPPSASHSCPRTAPASSSDRRESRWRFPRSC